MTIMGLNYLNYQETQRANLAKEAENLRSHQVSEKIGFGNLYETTRHNQAGEKLGYKSLDESIRHNKQNENVAWGNLKEMKEHNNATEKLGTDNLTELNRSNLQNEKVRAYSEVAPYLTGMERGAIGIDILEPNFDYLVPEPDDQGRNVARSVVNIFESIFGKAKMTVPTS